ncbi:MAG: FMN-binding protein [Erysipelotrichaceae bacterium]
MKKMVILPVFLAVVCLLSGLILSLVNVVTAPIIAEHAAKNANAALAEAFPDFPAADIELVGSDDANGILEIHKAGSEGYIYKLAQGGYGGDIIFYVAFDMEGNTVYYKVVEHNETSGIGDKIANDDYIADITSQSINDEVDLISGSTISSTAIKTGINAARVNFAENYASGLAVDLPSEPEVASVELAFADVEKTLVADDSANGINGIYQAADLGYVYDVSVKGYGGDINFIVAFDLNGVITYYGVVSASKETKGIGDKVTNSEFIDAVVGSELSVEIDLISGATVSSSAVVEGIELARNNFSANYQ